MGKIGGGRLKAFTLIFLNSALTRAASRLRPVAPTDILSGAGLVLPFLIETTAAGRLQSER
jgi:hypothetical protein